MPETVIRAIVPAADLPQEAEFNEIIDRAVIEKWNEKIQLYFYAALDEQKFNALSERQIIPLLKAINGVTGQAYDLTNSLVYANAIVIVTPNPRQALDRLRLVDIKRWFGAEENEFRAVEAAFNSNTTDCFRFVRVDEHRILKSIVFTSTNLAEVDQDKCLALNFLYMVGIRGKIEGTDSVGATGTSPRELGLLDQFALGVLYGKKSKPGVTFRQALSE